MSYSRLATYCNRTTQHYNGRFGNKICKITPHYMAAAWSGRQCADYFARNQRQASSNYCIGINGDIACSVDEENAAWTSSSWWNDSQAITIECGNINNATGEMTQATWNALVNLCVDICKRYGFRLNYTGTSAGSLTMHKMYAATACPGAWLETRMPQLAKEVNAKLDGSSVNVSTPIATPKPTCKYGVGTKVCTNTLWTQSQGGKKYTGDWSGTITRVIEGAEHPYLLNDGTGWTNDAGIDSDPHIPGGTAASTPTVLNSVPSDFVKENATFYPNCNLKIRKAPTEKGVDTGLIYASGMSVRYDGYVRREGFVWISWLSASSGERRWMKAGKLNAKGVNTSPYGRFL